MEPGLVHFQIDVAFVESHEALDVLDPVYWSVDIYQGPEEYEASLRPFTRAQRLCLGVFWYQAEVNNGGHDQFYFNSTGILWEDALAGLEMLGLMEFAAILRTSAERMGGSPPRDRELRQVVLDDLEPNFDDLDDRFYALEQACDLEERLNDWIHAHPADFTFEGARYRVRHRFTPPSRSGDSYASVTVQAKEANRVSVSRATRHPRTR